MGTYSLKFSTAALLCISVFASQAFAADVQIYGRADMNISVDNYHGGAKGGETNWAMNDGASRIGLNIREQINNDWSVLGYFEHGYKLDTGEQNTKGTMFDRRSILAVKSKRFGELGFGRMGTVASSNSPYGLGITMFDPFETAYTPDFTISGIFASDSRCNNSITYYSPRLAGWQFGATYSLQRSGQEQEESSNNDRVAAGTLSWTDGKFYGVLGGSTIMWGNTDSNAEREDSYEVMAGFNYKMTDTLTVYLGAQWFQDWRLFNFWRPQNHVSDTVVADKHGVDGQVYITGLRYDITGNTTLIGSYAYLTGEQKKGQTKLEGDRHRLSIGAEHYITKRTNLYLVGNYTKNTKDMVDLDGYEYKFSALAGITHKF